MFIRLARWRIGEIRGDDGTNLARLYELLLTLRDKKLLIVPETGHDLEVEAGARLVDETRTVMSQVSLGVKTHFRVGRDAQIYRGLRAYADRKPIFDLPWRDVFTQDPVAEISEEGPLVRVDLDTTPNDLAEHAGQRATLAAQLETIRLGARARRERFDYRLAVELRGVIEATLEIERSLMSQILAGTPASADEWIRYSFEVGRWKGALADYLKEVGRAGNDELAELIRFYGSPWWSNLPAIRILCELYALKLTGAEMIRPSDVTDMEQVAVLLPFADAMVLDRSMADKVRRLRLDKRYHTKVFVGTKEVVGWLAMIESRAEISRMPGGRDIAAGRQPA